MSRKGDCWDNAVVESFFKTLKVWRVYHRRYRTRGEATIAFDTEVGMETTFFVRIPLSPLEQIAEGMQSGARVEQLQVNQ